MVATAAAMIMVLSACTPATGDGDQTHDADLDQFYAQELDWGPCGEDFATSPREAEVLAASPAECAFLAVPLDYTDPGGAQASVAVSRVSATGEPIGALVFNPGGPGGSGVLGTVALSGQLGGLFPGGTESPSRITERFDIVGFDPRGVGATKPAADCYTPEGADRGDVLFPSLAYWPELTPQDTQAVLDRCAAGSGGIDALMQMSTRTAVQDMDVLRAALGDEQLSFLGQSYGTRLGAVYAEQFPDRVRAMVLDGAFDPELTTIDRFSSTFAGFQASFDLMAADCAERADCPLGADPSQATRQFQNIMQPLHQTPVPALDSELDFDEAIAAVILLLYSTEGWPALVAGISEVQQGRGDTFMQVVTESTSNPATAVNQNEYEALFAINCMDEQRLTPADVVQLKRQTYEYAPFMDRGGDITAGARHGCEMWPAKPTLEFPYAQNISGLPQTLVVSFTQDPTTPLDGAVSLADTLGGALLTVEGSEHTVVSSGLNACVDEIASDYLIDLTLPEQMPDC